MHHRLAILSSDARRAWFAEHNTLERLRQAGHSFIKSQIILYDAIKGDRYAIAWAISTLEEIP